MKKILLAGLLISGSLFAQTRSLEWGEVENQWSTHYENKYSQFIHTLGKARARGFCTTTHNCLVNPKSNPEYYSRNPRELQIESDCADLPFVLRSYFAWMNKLPFSLPSWPVKVLPPELEKLALQIEGFGKNNDDAQDILQQHKKEAAEVNNKIAEIKKRLKTLDRNIDEMLIDDLKLESREMKARKKELRKIVRSDAKDIKNIAKAKDKLKKYLAKKSKNYSKRDIRYTPYGTRIVKRIGARPNYTINHIVTEIKNKVSTASYRSRADKFDQGENYRDFYPVKINRQAIIPGTVLYDPSGHVAVVYEVTKDGRILLIDAHPDQSLTHIVYGKKFSRSSIKISGGFMNWRPVSYQGNEFIPFANDTLKDYSLVQFTGTRESDPDRINYKKAEFFFNGDKLDYYDYMRSQMFLGRVSYNPLNELSERVDELCEDLRARNMSIENAVAHQIHLKKHPKKLPKNIYGTSGEWEDYSTPSRDARFKALFLETQGMVKKYLKMEQNGDLKISYDGDNLALDMKRMYLAKANKCKISATLSTGRKKSFSLLDIEKRLFDLSFDPYHCVELRWGMTEVFDKKAYAASIQDEFDISASEKVAVCTDRTKIKWFTAEAGLRNQINRDYKEEMDYTLFGVKLHKLGVANRPSLNMVEVMLRYAL